MAIWQPEPGEKLLARTPVTFATGEATPVSGMRWFRDAERNDIQSELPGWPAGPVYEVRSTGDKITRNVWKVGWRALYVLVVGVLTSGGGSVGGGPTAHGSSDDRPDEVEDFPVMWAARGTIARTLPWQLDPARSPEKHYRTHAIVTDRRLLIVGLLYDEQDTSDIEDDVLWETVRSNISQVEPRDFRDERDVKVVFTDGSWCRLRAMRRTRFTRHLIHPLDLIPLESLTSAQRNTVEAFLANVHVEDPGSVVVSRRICGHYLIEVPVPSKLSSFFGASHRSLVMDSDGAEVESTDYHPDDF